jgi:hypothetical protein
MEYLPLLSTSVLPSRPAVTSNSPLSLFQISDQDTVPSVSRGKEGGDRYLAIPGTWAVGNFHQFTSFIASVSCTSEYPNPSIDLITAMCLCKQGSHEATCHSTRIVDLLYSFRTSSKSWYDCPTIGTLLYEDSDLQTDAVRREDLTPPPREDPFKYCPILSVNAHHIRCRTRFPPFGPHQKILVPQHRAGKMRKWPPRSRSSLHKTV